MAAPVIYRSTDSSAPVLTGTAGDLVNLLDLCLRVGYGSKAGAGWSKPYTATNAAVFRMGAGNQFYLDVNDNGTSTGLTSASGKEAAVRGYEVMTAASTGTNPFPTTAQVAATDANWKKSAATGSTARAWFCIADDRSFLLGVQDADTASVHKLYFFGDIYSLKSSDGYRTAVTVRTAPGGTSTVGTLGNALAASGGSVSAGWYTARIAAGTGTSNNGGVTGVGTTWDTVSPFTTGLDGNVHLLQLLANDVSTPMLRGRLRGLWQVLTPGGLVDGDTFDGSGAAAGRSFVVVKGFGGSADRCLAVETGAWDSSS